VDTSDSEPTSRVRPTCVGIEVATATRIGQRRVNADSVIVDEAVALFAVADGMGDAPSSVVAARAVLAAVGELFPPAWASLPHGERSPNEARERLRMGLALAHAKLLRPSLPKRERLGATFTGIVVCGELLAVGHVGDSRAQLLRAREGRMARLTEDHTVAGAALRRGMRAEDAARLEGARSVTQMVGATRTFEPDLFVRRWAAGDLAIVCTDGVSDNLAADTIATIVLDAPTIASAAQIIVDRAARGGASDNATVLLVHRTA
jgi:PPM family protein phosphatase